MIPLNGCLSECIKGDIVFEATTICHVFSYEAST